MSLSKIKLPEKPNADSHLKRAGPFLLGPPVSNAPVKCIANCLARRDRSDEFRMIKILTLPKVTSTEKEATEVNQGKTLIHTEYTLLNTLTGERGVVQQHGLFKDMAEEEIEVDGQATRTGQMLSRVLLVLDCYTPHDFSPKYRTVMNLQSYVIKEKRLPESLAMRIFHNVVEIVNRLHKRNIVHRDLKLGNIVLNKSTWEATITNFCLGKQLINEKEELKDQRGSPAYISPDVIGGKPYLGKPSDMWALGVVLYTMLFGQFPFYDSSPAELFRKIKLAEFQVPTDCPVTLRTVAMIKSLLALDPQKRLTASEALTEAREIIRLGETFLIDTEIQVVPDASLCSIRRTYRGSQYNPNVEDNVSSYMDIEQMLASCSNPKSETEWEKNDEDDKVQEPPTKVVRTAPAPLGGIIVSPVPEDSLKPVNLSRFREICSPLESKSKGMPSVSNNESKSMLHATITCNESTNSSNSINRKILRSHGRPTRTLTSTKGARSSLAAARKAIKRSRTQTTNNMHANNSSVS